MSLCCTTQHTTGLPFHSLQFRPVCYANYCAVDRQLNKACRHKVANRWTPRLPYDTIYLVWLAHSVDCIATLLLKGYVHHPEVLTFDLKWDHQWRFNRSTISRLALTPSEEQARSTSNDQTQPYGKKFVLYLQVCYKMIIEKFNQWLFLHLIKNIPDIHYFLCAHHHLIRWLLQVKI